MILNGFQKIIFQNRYVKLEAPLRPPSFMANTILNFHFDYRHPSLIILFFTIIAIIIILLFTIIINIMITCMETRAEK